ncbi:hypothetical protein R3P38DRAFT_331519 [Favolaschia claudopus]|uniref:Uncharacterized protein n=1 Tax=Favolaschia claudopus TaxID=2862362 RepID=A0AAV9ZM97_9AGAR
MKGVPETAPNQQSHQVNSPNIGTEPDCDDNVVGAMGGTGEAPGFQGKPGWLDGVDINRIEKMSTAEFCAGYQLENDIREKLEDEGFLTFNSLFYENEAALRSWGFNIGSVAEIQAALKRKVAEKHLRDSVVAQRADALDVGGGVGGAGGRGDTLGGVGGTGKGGLYNKNKLRGTAVTVTVRGGRGGAAGATRNPDPHDTNVSSSPTQSPGAGTMADNNVTQIKVEGLFVEGGVGGAGGWAPGRGGQGGEGQGPHIPMDDVKSFRSIDGGIGGVGGDAVRYGGGGGEGGAPELPTLLLSISEATRRKIPRAPLEDLGLHPALLKLLKDNGFRTVWGLLELHDTDLASDPRFKPGYPRVLQADLDRFCSKY